MKERNSLKLIAISILSSLSYAISHHFVNQTHFSRFPVIVMDYIALKNRGYLNQPLSSAAHHAVGTGSSLPFLANLYIISQKITGIDIRLLILLPLGAIFLPVVYLALIKILFGGFKSEISIFAMIYILAYLLHEKCFRASYVSAFAFPLFIISVFSIIKILRNDNSLRYSLILFFMITGVIGFWHTAAFITVTFIFAVACIIVLANILNRKLELADIEVITRGISSKILIFIATLSAPMVIYFKFSIVKNYLKEFIFNSNFDFIDTFLRTFRGAPTLPFVYQKYQFNYKSMIWGKIYFVSHMTIHLIAIFLIIFSILLAIKKLFTNKKISGSLLSLLLVASGVFISQIVFSIAYSGTATGFFYVTYIFPIIGGGLLWKIDKNKKRLILLCFALLIISAFLMAISSHVTDELGYTPDTKYEDTGSSFIWTASNMDQNKTIYADFNILYKYLYREIMNRVPSISYADIKSSNYIYIVGHKSPPDGFSKNYVAIDDATMSDHKPINTYEGRGLLIPMMDSINENVNLQKLYADGHISIYQFC